MRYDNGRVLSPEDARLPHLSETLIPALHLTNTDQIITGEEVQPPAFLGPEPEHGWCYYYAKAALDEQQGKWEEVVSLEEQANNLGLTPFSPAELTVIIKGYAHLGQADRSLALSEKAVEMDPAFSPFICQVWDNIPRYECFTKCGDRILAGRAEVSLRDARARQYLPESLNSPLYATGGCQAVRYQDD